MRFFNFSLEGKNAKNKILNLSATRYPKHRIYANDTLTCFNLTNYHTELLAVFIFNYEDNPDKIQINIGSTDHEFFDASHTFYESIAVNKEYKFFRDWSDKWGLKMSEPKQGCYPSLDAKLTY